MSGIDGIFRFWDGVMDGNGCARRADLALILGSWTNRYERYSIMHEEPDFEAENWCLASLSDML
jgi:hypothetical protein